VLDAERLEREAFEPLLHSVLGATRIYVAAWATGIGRGAFEVALGFARSARYRGRSLLSSQFAQRCLVDMLANVHTARAVYLQALSALLAANGGSGMPELAGSAWFRALYHSRLSRRLRHDPRVQRALLQRASARNASTTSRVQFQASLAKVVASDLAMQNCQRALELMGSAGLRHGAGAEKLFRDAKLCQIFEGTNQLNRLHMAQHALSGRAEHMEVF
jgi:alkylation response protein AidB-like acyl-CoA dehydrogenase